MVRVYRMFKIENMTSDDLAGSGHEFTGRTETNHGRKRSKWSSVREMTDVTIFSVTPMLKNRRYHIRGITVNNFINTQ